MSESIGGKAELIKYFYSRGFGTACIDEFKKRDKAYRQTDAGKIVHARDNAKRRREFKYEPMNQYFNECHGHHLDFKNVLFVPEDLHMSTPHRQSDEESMTKINILAWTYLESSAY